MREDQSQTGRRRLTVAEASDVLGVTVEAVRGRIKRGTLEHERTKEGVFVLLDADQSHERPRPEAGQTTDRLRSDDDALVSAKDETIATLREQLQAERQAHAEARGLLAAALERIPAIEAPEEASEVPETVEEAPDLAEAQDELGAERARRETAEATLHEGMQEERRRREAAERERDALRRELHASSRQQGAHEAAQEQQGRGQPRSTAEGAQEGGRRPWWRRMFRG